MSTPCISTFGSRAGAVTRSTCKKKTLTPKWEESFALECDDDDVLDLAVEDQDVVSSNDHMCSCSVEAATLADRRCHRKWFPLIDRRGGAAGRVELALRRVHDPAFERPLPESLLAETPSDEPPPNGVRVFVCRAKNLPVMDRNLVSKGGSSDPFAIVRVGLKKKKTIVVPKSLRPTWDALVALPTRGASHVDVVVADADALRVQPMGPPARIPLTDLTVDAAVRAWLPVGERGRVDVAARLVYDPAFAAPLPKTFLKKLSAKRPANAMRVAFVDGPETLRGVLGTWRLVRRRGVLSVHASSRPPPRTNGRRRSL